MANVTYDLSSDTSVYKYTAEITLVVDQDVYYIYNYNIRSIVIDNDYKMNHMPLVFVVASISKKIIDVMVANQNKATMIFNLKRCTINSDMPGLYTDYINDKFIYFLPDDINKNDEYDYQDINKDREDLFRVVSFGLLCVDHVNKNKKVLNGVIDGKLSSIMYYLTSHYESMVMEPPTNNVQMNRVFLPPTNSVAKSLKYLNSLQVLYSTPYRFFNDFDCTYLISSSGKAVPKQGETINTVMITLKNAYDQDSKVQGMTIDEAQGMYKIDVDGIDCELADNHTADKSYSTIMATDATGSSNKTKLSTTDNTILENKTRSIRISNNNTGLVDNMKAALDTSAIQLLVQKTDIDSSVITVNKEYVVKADEVYGSDEYDGKYILSRRRDIYIREDEDFVMSTSMILEKIPEES